MSATTVIFPIIAALIAPEGEYFKNNNIWNPINHFQEYFLTNCYSKRSELSHFNQKELQVWVSPDYKYLNTIAKGHNFDIHFQPFEPNEIGSLSIFDISLKWLKVGEQSRIKYKGKPYEAIEFDSGFSVFNSDNFPHPIVKIKTKSKDVVYMAIADEPLEKFELLEKIYSLQRFVKETKEETYDELTFPKAILNHIEEISWLKKMWCPHKTEVDLWWEVTEAFQQTKFTMDKEGAYVQSGVVVQLMMKTSAANFKKTVNINKPFYIWIEREGCVLPIFTGYLDETSWSIIDITYVNPFKDLFL